MTKCIFSYFMECMQIISEILKTFYTFRLPIVTFSVKSRCNVITTNFLHPLRVTSFMDNPLNSSEHTFVQVYDSNSKPKKVKKVMTFRCQIHQHFTGAFFVCKSFQQLFSSNGWLFDFWCQNFVQKCVSKKLMKLTLGLN